MRLAAMELNEHQPSADRQWLLFDPITITRSAATAKAQGVDRDAIVDASGHHYTDAVLAVSASKLRQLLQGSPVPMRRAVFTHPNQPAWKPSELCGRRALACVMPAACPRGGCPQVEPISLRSPVWAVGAYLITVVKPGANRGPRTSVVEPITDQESLFWARSGLSHELSAT
jgi:hypothetical protein